MHTEKGTPHPASEKENDRNARKEKLNVLFVCSMNKWRSRTAETIYQNSSEINVKSAGTSSSARTKINQNHLDWADIVFVMEKKHRNITQQKFDLNPSETEIIILYIEDDYQYMDPELIDILKAETDSYLHLDQR